MAKKSDFEINLVEDEEDSPMARKHPMAGVLVAAVEGAPEMPEGQMAHFRFADGVTLEIHIPHAIGVGGGGVAEHAVPWFVLRGADRSVMNEGPLVGVA